MESREYSERDRELARIAFEEQEKARLIEQHVFNFELGLLRVEDGIDSEADLLSVDLVKKSDPLQILLPSEAGISFNVNYSDIHSRLMEKIENRIVNTNEPEKILKVPEPRTKYLKNFIDIHPGVNHPAIQKSIQLASSHGTLFMITIDRYYLKYDEDIFPAETWTGIRIDYLGRDSGGEFSKTSKKIPHPIATSHQLPFFVSGEKR